MVWQMKMLRMELEKGIWHHFYFAVFAVIMESAVI